MELEKINISDKNILKYLSTNSEYVYSKTYDRIYKRVGDIDLHNVPGDDGIPTILVDTNSYLLDFIILKAENTYAVLDVPDGFSYKEYSKNIKRC